MPSTRPIRVLMSMHPGFDVLDFFGPLDVLSLARSATTNGKLMESLDTQPSAFDIATTSPEALTMTTAGVEVARTVTLDEAYERLAEFDVLMIPGGSSSDVLKSYSEPMKLIKAFASLPPRPSTERVIMSVCTGALFLASAGVLHGQTVTTNTQHLQQLRIMVSGSDTTVVHDGQRFVVNTTGTANSTKLEGYRIITSAGPGAGLDLSFWVIEHYLGKPARENVEAITEIKARLDEGLVLAE